MVGGHLRHRSCCPPVPTNTSPSHAAVPCALKPKLCCSLGGGNPTSSLTPQKVQARVRLCTLLRPCKCRCATLKSQLRAQHACGLRGGLELRGWEAGRRLQSIWGDGRTSKRGSIKAGGRCPPPGSRHLLETHKNGAIHAQHNPALSPCPLPLAALQLGAAAGGTRAPVATVPARLWGAERALP